MLFTAKLTLAVHVNNNKEPDTIKKKREREERFYSWLKGLNPDLNKDTVSEETHNFTYSKYTIDGKTRKKTSD